MMCPKCDQNTIKRIYFKKDNKISFLREYGDVDYSFEDMDEKERDTESIIPKIIHPFSLV